MRWPWQRRNAREAKAARRFEPPELRRVRDLVHMANRLGDAVARELPDGVRDSRT